MNSKAKVNSTDIFTPQLQCRFTKNENGGLPVGSVAAAPAVVLRAAQALRGHQHQEVRRSPGQAGRRDAHKCSKIGLCRHSCSFLKTYPFHVGEIEKNTHNFGYDIAFNL